MGESHDAAGEAARFATGAGEYLGERQLDGARLTVIDQGQGIDEGDLPFVFDRFCRGRRQPPGE